MLQMDAPSRKTLHIVSIFKPKMIDFLGSIYSVISRDYSFGRGFNGPFTWISRTVDDVVWSVFQPRRGQKRSLSAQVRRDNSIIDPATCTAGTQQTSKSRRVYVLC